MSQKKEAEPVWARIDFVTRTRGIARCRQYALIASGQIEASKDGRATLIRLATVDDYLQRQRVTAFPAADEMRRRRQVHQKRVRASVLVVAPKAAA